MDGSRFDALVRAWSTNSRRSRRRLLASGGLAALLGTLGGLTAEAKCVKLGKKCDRKEDRCCGGAKCKGKKCRCTGRKEVCKKKCCPANQMYCIDGVCACFGPNKVTVCDDCPAGDELCKIEVFQQCCLADDTCDPVNACMTGTGGCTAENEFCKAEWAFCDDLPCGCFRTSTGTEMCADLTPFLEEEEDLCPPTSECSDDEDCDPGQVCVDVSCCGDSPEFVSRCVAPCPPEPTGTRADGGARVAALKRRLAHDRATTRRGR